MAGESGKIKVQATAKLEKYPVGTSEKDIKSGKIKPEEIVKSEDILIDPTPNALRVLKDMGFKITPELQELVDMKVKEKLQEMKEKKG
jgi:hypothetical protein